MKTKVPEEPLSSVTPTSSSHERTGRLLTDMRGGYGGSRAMLRQIASARTVTSSSLFQPLFGEENKAS